MRFTPKCSYKSNAWLDGYEDGRSGKLFSDENQFCKTAYAEGFFKGQQFCQEDDIWLVRSDFYRLINENLDAQQPQLDNGDI